jgi:hypothetical protein
MKDPVKDKLKRFGLARFGERTFFANRRGREGYWLSIRWWTDWEKGEHAIRAKSSMSTWTLLRFRGAADNPQLRGAS